MATKDTLRSKQYNLLQQKSNVGVPDLRPIQDDLNTLSDLIDNNGNGDMSKAVYDPQNISGDAFARANHTGSQLAATISNFAATTRAVALTGFVAGPSSTVLATDTVLEAFQKAQAQINTLASGIGDLTADRVLASDSDGDVSVTTITYRNGNFDYVSTKGITWDGGDTAITGTGSDLSITSGNGSVSILAAGGAASLIADTNITITAGDGATLSLASQDSDGVLLLTSDNLRFNSLTANRAIYLDADKDATASVTTGTELGYLSGVTSAVQTQINNIITSTGLYIPRAGTTIVNPITGDLYFNGYHVLYAADGFEINGEVDLNLNAVTGQVSIVGATGIALDGSANVSASKALVTDGQSKMISSVTTLTELSYVSGVTSAIQTQINGKQSSLTFSTGLTNTTGTITANLAVGVAGGQTAIGGTQVGDSLLLKGTTGIGTAGSVGVGIRVGSNGATTSANFLNDGTIQFGGATATNRLIDFKQDTAFAAMGSRPGATSQFAIWLDQATPDTTNFAIASNGGDTQLNAPSGNNLTLRIGASTFSTLGLTSGSFVAGYQLGVGITPTVNFQVHTANTDTTSTIKFTNASTTTWEALANGTTRIGPQNGSYMTVMPKVSDTGYVGLYANVTPNSANYFMYSNGSETAIHGPGASGSVRIVVNGTVKFSTGQTTSISTQPMTIGVNTAPTAMLMIAAGTATANTAPLKFLSGTNNTTAEAGTMEYDGSDLFFTKSGTTRGTVLVATAVTTEALVSDRTLTITHAGVTYKLLAVA